MTTKTKKITKSKSKFDFRTIKTFEDACKKQGIDSGILPDVSALLPGFAKPIIAYYKLVIIFMAINDGWVADWNNWNQLKYYPWFRVLPSGSGFGRSYSNYDFDYAIASVGSRLCTNTSEKALYMAKQFEAEYVDFMLLN